MSELHNISIEDLAPATTIAIRETVEMAAMAPFFDRAFGALGAALATQGLVPTDAPYARYFGEPTDTADIEVGFPVAGVPLATDDIHVSSLPGGRAAVGVLHGSYDGLGAAWGAMYQWILAQGETATPTMWETYVTEPSPDMDPAVLRTRLTWPLV